MFSDLGSIENVHVYLLRGRKIYFHHILGPDIDCLSPGYFYGPITEKLRLEIHRTDDKNRPIKIEFAYREDLLPDYF